MSVADTKQRLLKSYPINLNPQSNSNVLMATILHAYLVSHYRGKYMKHNVSRAYVNIKMLLYSYYFQRFIP